jgi:hypothetical protein
MLTQEEIAAEEEARAAKRAPFMAEAKASFDRHVVDEAGGLIEEIASTLASLKTRRTLCTPA